jgi:hypothetical protein
MSFTDSPSYLTSLGRRLAGGATVGSISVAAMTATTGDTIATFVGQALGVNGARSLNDVPQNPSRHRPRPSRCCESGHRSFVGCGPMVAAGCLSRAGAFMPSGSWRPIALVLRGFQAAVDGVELGQVPGFAVGCRDYRVLRPSRARASPPGDLPDVELSPVRAVQQRGHEMAVPATASR